MLLLKQRKTIMEGIFSMQPTLRLVIQLLVELVEGCSCELEQLVAEAGDSSGTQRKGNIWYWKPLPSNG
jgi:hypothetical protein